MPASTVPAFMIVGTPRSGTTLCQRLACELDGVVVPPETHFFSLFAPSLLDHQRFPLAGTELVREFDRFAALRTSRSLGLHVGDAVARVDGRVGSILQMFEAVLRTLTGDAPTIGEKTPNHLLWWRVLAVALPSVRFVAMVRDPRAVVASYRQAWGSRDHTVLAERWVSDQQQVRALADTLGPQRSLILKYEDVVVNPQNARDRLAGFVGSPEGDGQQTRFVFLPWEGWKEGAMGPITRTRTAAWKDVLSPAEEADILAIASGEMRLAGYGDAASSEESAHQRVAAMPRDQQWKRQKFRIRRAVKLARIAATRLS
jgi:hypothetical protein